jgi:predicted Zn-dependent protease
MSFIKNTITCIFMSLLLYGALHPDVAQAQGVIRDAEIEHDLRVIGDPIFDSAGLIPDQVRIIIINEDVINAFVAGGQNLFLYTGLILATKNVSELAGVMAHESGHMAGGHLIRMEGMAEHASVESLIAMALGVAVGVGGHAGDAGMATAMGGGELANRLMLSHTRVIESSADQSGMASLSRLGYSAQGMSDFLGRLSQEEVLPEMQRSQYALTHPLSRERMEAVNAYIANHPGRKEFPAEWQEDYKRLRAKIMAFNAPDQALAEYATDDSIVGKYARAIALYRKTKISDALKMLDGLQSTEPTNGYFYDLRGQIQFEQGRINESIDAWRRATELEPKEGLIHLSLAQALLQDEKRDPDEALRHLMSARDNGEQDTSQVYRWMAVAYGREGNEGRAKLSLAEEAMLKGDKEFAIDQARRAEKLLTNDPTSLQQARDIEATAGRMKKDKK